MKHLHAELKEIISKFSIEYIFFITDTFLAMSEKEFDEFCEMYAEFKLPFYMHTRPETITERRAKKLAEVGCHKVNIGVEHGNQKFRTEIVGRAYKNEIAIKSLELKSFIPENRVEDISEKALVPRQIIAIVVK